MHLALWLLLLEAAIGAEREVVVVTAAAPIDSQRLADAMRTYLGDFRIEVRAAPTGADGDLRRQLAETRQVGEAVRAVAAIRVGGAQPDVIEIQLVDRVTDKALVSQIPRPRGDEDLYRSVALKVQSLLRSTLAEEPELLAERPQLAGLTPGSARQTEGGPTEARLSLALGYVLSSFPFGGLAHHGVSVAGEATGGEVRRLRARLTLGVAVAALRSQRSSRGDLSVVVDELPLTVTLGLRWGGHRVEGLGALAAQLAALSVAASDPEAGSATVRSLAAGAGVVLEGRWLVGVTTWIYLRGNATGMLLSDRYSARGGTVVETSWLHIEGSAGLGFVVR